MYMVKGYTVHLDVNGKAACGVTPRGFAGSTGISKNPRRVTCAKCESMSPLSADELAQLTAHKVQA